MGVVKIHVFDEARCLRQDFACEHGVLLASMQYVAAFAGARKCQQLLRKEVHVMKRVQALLLCAGISGHT